MTDHGEAKGMRVLIACFVAGAILLSFDGEWYAAVGAGFIALAIGGLEALIAFRKWVG